MTEEEALQVVGVTVPSKSRTRKLNAFGKASRKYRIDHDMRLKDMAKLLGCTVAYISNAEYGITNINPDSPVGLRFPDELRVYLLEHMANEALTQAKIYKDQAKYLQQKIDRSKTHE